MGQFKRLLRVVCWLVWIVSYQICGKGKVETYLLAHDFLVTPYFYTSLDLFRYVF